VLVVSCSGTLYVIGDLLGEQTQFVISVQVTGMYSLVICEYCVLSCQYFRTEL